MKKYLRAYSEANPEKFNRDFILSRNDADILEYVKDIFKALEILGEIEILDITLETDESTFGPIKNQHQYYKAIMPSRLNKIHYKVRITPSEGLKNTTILKDKETDEEEISDYETDTTPQVADNSFIIERDLFLNKVIENSFYINEGIRYFLIYQIESNLYSF